MISPEQTTDTGEGACIKAAHTNKFTGISQFEQRICFIAINVKWWESIVKALSCTLCIFLHHHNCHAHSRGKFQLTPFNIYYNLTAATLSVAVTLFIGACMRNQNIFLVFWAD